MKKIAIICVIILTIFNSILTPKSGLTQTKKIIEQVVKAANPILQTPVSDKESENAIKINDSANRRIDKIFEGIGKKEDKTAAYIVILEENNALLKKENASQAKKIKWWQSEHTKLKAENSSITLLKSRRHAGDTLPLIFSFADRTEFVQHISDSIRATLPPPDTILEIHRIFRKTIYKSKNK